MKKIIIVIARFLLFLNIVNCGAVELIRRLHWVKNGQRSALVFDDVQPLFDTISHITRDGIQLGNDSPIKLSGYLIFDSYANVMCGSLAVNGQSIWYDTPAYHSDFDVMQTFAGNANYENTIFLTNGFVFFFTGQQYTVDQVDSGAVLPILRPYNVVYHKGVNTASSFMRFNSGFTILPDASASMSTLITITGPVDLRETGTLTFAGDLTLESHITLSSGGNIDGQGHKLMLSGNLMFPENKIFHIMSDTVIDGQGYTLSIGDYGQLFVDNAITLTLHNIVLKSGATTSVFPPLRCAGQTSKVVLDNMTLLSGADIPFYQGQLFVQDDVHFTGTSAFVYASPQSSFIMPSSSLTFDPLTTFSFAPATMSNNQIIMANATSSLVFNGSTLKCTDTGLRLTKGSLTYQGSVTVDTKNGLYLSSVTSVTGRNYGGMIYTCGWRPDGKYIAVGGYGPVTGKGSGFNNAEEIRVYSFDGTNLNPITSRTYGSNVLGLSWSPDGQFLAIVGQGPVSGGTTGFTTAEEIRMYRFDAASATLVPITSRSYGSNCRAVRWSNDGRYLAVSGDGAASGGTTGFVNTNIFRIYGFNGQTLAPITSTNGSGGSGYAIAWHPTGQFIVFGGTSSPMNLYRFDGSSLMFVTSASVTAQTAVWSPDGNYVGSTMSSTRIHRFDWVAGVGTLTQVGSSISGSRTGMDWCSDGKNIVTIGSGVSNVYRFTGSSLASVNTLPNPYQYPVFWDPTGNFVAFSRSLAGLPYVLSIYKTVWGSQPNPQAATNSLVYGNAALGSGANLTVNGLPTTVRGNVLNENV